MSPGPTLLLADRGRRSVGDVQLRVVRQARVVGGADAERPTEAAIAFGNGDVVDAGLAPPHVAGLVELPLLISMGAPPLAGVVMPFVLEADRDAVAGEGPEFLHQPVVRF